MTESATKRAWPPLVELLLRHRIWIIVGATVLLALIVRVRLRDMPLERDEGEYAFAGQLILHGVPPYQEAYNLKLPGTYAFYALIMLVFGQNPGGIHFGLALLNAVSIVLMYLIGRQLLDEPCGAGAAVAFGLLSLSPSVLGLAAHATHFVVLFALAGLLALIWRPAAPAVEREDRGANNGSSLPNLQLAVSGLCFGLAFLMKQHGLMFGVFAGLYLIWTWLNRRLGWEAQRQIRLRKTWKSKAIARRTEAGRGGRSTARPVPGGPETRSLVLIRRLAIFSAAFVVPYAIACLVLLASGAFQQFVFWTISYAAKYASAISMINGPELLRGAVAAVVGPNLMFWLLPWVGALVMWWDDGLGIDDRFLLTVLLLCSIAAISLGFYFREHYFILLLPALSLLCGVAASRGMHLLRNDTTIELFLAVPMVGLYAVGALAALIGNGALWFGMPPAAALREIYGSTLFSEVAKVSDYLKANTGKDSRIAVMGSEPEIYFYAHRRSATGYIYTYSLMEEQPYALKMQEEMIAEIERRQPEYIVYVQDDYSWLPRPASQRRLNEWWEAYWSEKLDLVKTFDVLNTREDVIPPKAGGAIAASTTTPPPLTHLLVFKRKTEARAAVNPGQGPG